jgi:hypothetical protein
MGVFKAPAISPSRLEPVLIQPGPTQLTVIPCLATSIASARDMPVIAALAAQYALSPGLATRRAGH